jgi:hypothetical protein
MNELLDTDDYTVELQDEEIILCYCNAQHKSLILGTILPMLWSSDFFSITQIDTEFSFFVNKKKYEAMMKQISSPIPVSTIECSYYPLKVYQVNHQINELGIVARIAQRFQELEIPICMSTVSTATLS